MKHVCKRRTTAFLLMAFIGSALRVVAQQSADAGRSKAALACLERANLTCRIPERYVVKIDATRTTQFLGPARERYGRDRLSETTFDVSSDGRRRNMNHFRKFSRIGSDDPRQRTEHRFRLLWNGEIGLSQQTSRFSDPSLANEPSPPSFVGFTHDPSYAMARLQGWPGLNLLFHQLQPDAMSWVEIARTAERLSIGDRSEKVDGIPCDVLEATGKYGQFRLWLDPQNEYILRKAVVLKKNDDLVLETLGSSPLNVLLKQGESVLPRRVESRSTLDGVKVAKVGDRYFVSESVETVEVFYEDGGKLIDTTRSHWAYSLDPDSESRGVFDWKIPNGQAMFEVDRSGGGVSYEWRDGRPVPVVDRQFLKEMDVSLKKLDLPSRVAVPSDTPSSRTEGKSHDAATTLGLREISYVASFAVENSAKAASSNKSRWIVVAGLGLVLSILLVKKLRPQKTRGPK